MGYVTRYPTEPDDPSWPEYNLAECEDTEQDQPIAGIKLESHRLDGLPPLVIGTGTFSNLYDDSASVTDNVFLRMTRLSLRYGVNAFDTAPHYHPSEIVLGKALKALRNEYPRESYQIITKTGKFSSMLKDHDLSENMTCLCVERSLRRFETDYLDVVYLHDVEFNSSLNPPAGNHVLALSDPKIAKEYGLAPEDEGKIWGEGDQRILDAMSVLRELKKEGKIKRIGFSAYPLPTLLRLALLVLHNSKEPVDIIQTYSHQNLQNTGLTAYLTEFQNRAKVQTVMNASPLNMGLLTTSGPPAWHPASPELRQAMQRGRLKIEDLALSFGMRDFGADSPPVVVGCSTLAQVHQAVASYVTVKHPKDKAQDERLQELEERIRQHIESKGFKDWSWKSPQPGT
ncbi:hypothetical protein QFC20_003627 [Naganishia adeliensis]|uniref:Uncharacterized protein n=1 Tax=Naganishia adeliensis TaxID=92952 RepID=A0ACC2W9E3_9TREE|nr:hypothetical protein QFC20_003627 [Naganishia adeliensis]